MAVYNVKSLSFTKGDNTYNIDAGSSYYAVCSTAGSTQTKTVTIDEITALEEGLSVRIIFSNDQLYNGVPKLQINSLTAANIQSVAGVDGEQYMWKAGEVIDLVYNGTNWIVVGRGATPSTRIIQVNTTVTNTSGSYTTTIQDARITSDMKALSLEISNPYVFNDKITVTCTNGSVTFACNDVCGTSAVTINIVKAALDATTITSEEFDTLDAEKLDKTDFFATEMPMSSSDNTKVAAAISAIESDLDDKQDAADNNLSTTAKTVVGAINENASGIISNSTAISNLNLNLGGAIAIVCDGDTHPYLPQYSYIYVTNNTHGLTDGLYQIGSSGRAENSQITSSMCTAVSNGGINALNSKFTTIEDKKITRIGTYFTERDAFKARRVGNAITLFSYVNITTQVPSSTEFANTGFSSAEGLFLFFDSTTKETIVRCSSGKLIPNDTLATGYYYAVGSAVTPI